MPDYDERKRKQFHDLQAAFKQEVTKTFPERDDDYIMNLRDEIMLFAKTFSSELEGK